MNQLKQNVEVAEQTVLRMKREISDAKKDIQIQEEELVRLKERMCALGGSGGGRDCGALGKAATDLSQAKLNLADDSATVVVWKTERSWSRNDTVWVVDKITLKRIYIRVKGANDRSYYDKETGETNHLYDGVIDLEATFPEGLS